MVLVQNCPSKVLVTTNCPGIVLLSNGPRKMLVPNGPRMVLVPNYPRMVLVPNCPRMVFVPNCPRMVLVPNWHRMVLVPNWPRMVLVPNCHIMTQTYKPCCPLRNNNIGLILLDAPLFLLEGEGVHIKHYWSYMAHENSTSWTLQPWGSRCNGCISKIEAIRWFCCKACWGVILIKQLLTVLMSNHVHIIRF